MNRQTSPRWPLSPLDEVAEVQGGIQKQQARRPVHSKYPFLRVANVQRGQLDLREVHQVELFPGELERLALRRGDLLVVEGNGNPDEVGRAAMWSGAIENCVHQNHLIRVRPGERLIPEFLELLWNSPSVTRQLRRVANSTSGLHTLSTSKLRAVELPVPPLSDQKHVVDLLDLINAQRVKRRRSLALLKELIGSIFMKTFGDPARNQRGWPLHELGNLGPIFSDGPFGSNLKSSHYTSSGVRVVRLQNIGIGSFLDQDRVFVSQLHFNSLKRHTCLAGDVLIATLGDPNIRACVQPEHVPIALNKADCVQLRVDPRIVVAEFIATLLNHSSIEEMARSRMLGQTRTRISMGRLRTLAVPIPPLHLQRRFCARLAELRAASRQSQAHLAELDALFTSVQNRAFQGELWPDSAA